MTRLPPLSGAIGAPALAILIPLREACPEALQARLRRLSVLDAAHLDYEVVLVGFGRPDDLAPVLRAAMQADPRHRALLHTRPVRASEALVAGVRHARAPWVVLLADDGHDVGEVDKGLEQWRFAQSASPTLTCVSGAPGEPVLVARDAFLALKPIPGMRRFVPELFPRQHRASVDPSHHSARRRLHGWLRSAWVALLCTMNTRPAPPAHRVV